MFGFKARQAERDRIAAERAAARDAAVDRLGGNAAADQGAPAVHGDGMTFGTDAEVVRQRAAKARAEVRRAEGDRLDGEAAGRG